MNVTQYLFQSPSPNQVQVGRPDPSSMKEDTTTTTSDAPQQNVVKTNPLKEVAQSTPVVEDTVTPVVNSDFLIDTYA